jgi:hypothetical protein
LPCCAFHLNVAILIALVSNGFFHLYACFDFANIIMSISFILLAVHSFHLIMFISGSLLPHLVMWTFFILSVAACLPAFPTPSSGGERNRVHLAKMLRSGCNVLMLDEPTNDLDVDTLRALEDALPDFVGSAIVRTMCRCSIVVFGKPLAHATPPIFFQFAPSTHASALFWRRTGDFARPLVSGPHLHSHSRLRGRWPHRLCRGQL